MALSDRTPTLATIGLATLVLRPQLLAIGPLLVQIQSDLGISHAVAGLLPAIPVVCMGVFAPSGVLVAGRIGTRAGLTLCLALVSIAGLLRALVPGAAGVILMTIPIGIGMGLAGSMLPVLIKERFPLAPATGTSVYATGLTTGATLAAALAVPIADVTGGWRGSLLVFSAVSLAITVAWAVLSGGLPTHVRSKVRPPRLPWRSGIAWALALVYGIDGVLFHGLSSWLPAAYTERGWSETSSGALLAVLQVSALVFTATTGWVAERFRARRPLLLGASSLAVFATLGLVLAPAAGFLWTVFLGASVGALFPLLLTLPLDLADRPENVGAIAALMLLGGYTLSALGPVLLGAARDATGSFTDALWVSVGLSVVLVVACLPFTNRRIARGAGMR